MDAPTGSRRAIDTLPGAALGPGRTTRSGAGSEATASGRLLSLDAFRGITIAGMILVNNPGTWRAVYWPLTHAEWHGWTPTDLIFPFFLFIVGVSLTLALARRVGLGARPLAVLPRIAARSLILFALGLFLAGLPSFDLATIRIPGVLQRIAVCYLVAALLFLTTSRGTQAIIAVALLLSYWAAMTLVPVPGFGPGILGKEGNLAAYLDRMLLGAHIWQAARVYDPEGILSTIPAIATTLAGVLAGHWLRSTRTRPGKAIGLLAAGVVAAIAGSVWGIWFPINKALWTSSYVLLTAGLALQGLAVCYWLIEIAGYRRWARPFVVLGVNAIAAFVLSTLCARLMSLVEIPRADGSPGTLQSLIYERGFAPWATPVNGSLLYAVAYTLVWILLMWWLSRRRIFITV